MGTSGEWSLPRQYGERSILLNQHKPANATLDVLLYLDCIYLDTKIWTDYWALNISTYWRYLQNAVWISVFIYTSLSCAAWRIITISIEVIHWYTTSSSTINLSQTRKSNLHFVSECVYGSTRSGTQQVVCHMSGKEIGLSWYGERQCSHA